MWVPGKTFRRSRVCLENSRRGETSVRRPLVWVSASGARLRLSYDTNLKRFCIPRHLQSCSELRRRIAKPDRLSTQSARTPLPSFHSLQTDRGNTGTFPSAPLAYLTSTSRTTLRVPCLSPPFSLVPGRPVSVLSARASLPGPQLSTVATDHSRGRNL